MKISKQYSFDAAHRLFDPMLSTESNVEQFGKCYQMHGHTYYLEVEIAGSINDINGMVLNYFNLDEVVKPLIEMVDHRFLNEVFKDILTTTENLVGIMAGFISAGLWNHPKVKTGTYLSKVILQETPKTKAIWEYESV